MNEDLKKKQKKFKDQKKTTQDIIFKETKKSLKSNNIQKQIKPLVSGKDDETWTICGSENITFKFHTEDYGKQVISVTVSIAIKTTHSEKVVTEEFADKDFANNLRNLFLNKEKEKLQQTKNRTQEQFMELFKTNLK
jgi:hypothetical protein